MPQPGFTDRAIDLVAEDKLRRAYQDGLFAGLTGWGRPLPLDDEPDDPHWWLRRRLKADRSQAPDRREHRTPGAIG